MWFSLIVDETTDISVKEQVSICLRYVSKTFQVHEDFVDSTRPDLRMHQRWLQSSRTYLCV